MLMKAVLVAWLISVTLLWSLDRLIDRYRLRLLRRKARELLRLKHEARRYKRMRRWG